MVASLFLFNKMLNRFFNIRAVCLNYQQAILCFSFVETSYRCWRNGCWIKAFQESVVGGRKNLSFMLSSTPEISATEWRGQALVTEEGPFITLYGLLLWSRTPKCRNATLSYRNGMQRRSAQMSTYTIDLFPVGGKWQWWSLGHYISERLSYGSIEFPFSRLLQGSVDHGFVYKSATLSHFKWSC